MDILIVIVLCLIGIALILAEIFLIPGFTITSIAGAAFLIGGVYYSFLKLGIAAGIVTLVSVVVIIGFTIVYLIKSKALEKTIALKTDISSTVAPKELPDIFAGDKGITLSRLNPIGKVRVNNITMEAKALSDFIDENTTVTIIKVSSTQLIVTTK